MLSSDSPTGPFARVTGLTRKWPSSSRGNTKPAVVRLEDDRWCLFLDYYGTVHEKQGYVPFIANRLEGHFVGRTNLLLPLRLSTAMAITRKNTQREKLLSIRRLYMKNPVIPQNAGDPYILKDGANYPCRLPAAATGTSPALSAGIPQTCRTGRISDHTGLRRCILGEKQSLGAFHVVEKDGYYYFAFCADQQIGIAVCDAPMGTYKDILGHPLVAKTDYDFQTIDPCFLKDDDGTVYLAFGQGKV